MMTKQAHYNAAQHISPNTAPDPYNRPAFSLQDRLKRLAWNIVAAVLFRLSPRPFFAWRALLLRLFGAQLGAGCKFYPAARIYAPWNLSCDDLVAVADGAEIYNPAPMRFGSHAILSQACYLCGATHDFDDPAFPLLTYAMEVGPYAWICARASVAPGVQVGAGAVLGLASVATRNLEPWTVYAGAPAIKVKDRQHAS
jgi:putative colanic acid biosynthesis acetyltransferase WcaF